MNRDEWKIRDRKMRVWRERERRHGGFRLHVSDWYRDLPSRRPACDRYQGDPLLAAPSMRWNHVATCRRVDWSPVLCADSGYIDFLRRHGAPVGRLP